MNSIFNQTIINNTVICPICKEPVDLRDAWFDPYVDNGKEVHLNCLSIKRKNECKTLLKE